MTLPKGTFLGKLSLIEVYADYDGPKLFAVVNEARQHFIGVATDEDELAMHWIYASVSRETLERIRAGAEDVAVPFRRPPDGFLVRVVTPRSGADTAESVRREDVPVRELPRKGFPLALTSLPEQWRLDALMAAVDVGERAHEARLKPKEEPEALLQPDTVAGLLRRWERFWSAIVPKTPLRIAHVLPGSLRVIFVAPAIAQKRLVDAYEDLVACGSDELRLRRATRTRGVGVAYYDLVHFISEHASDLELASVRPTGTGGQRLNLICLPVELATAQAHALARLQEDRRDRTLIADVLAASKPKGTLELGTEKGERIEGILTLQARKFITGLKIGSRYTFEFTQTTRVGAPSAAARTELDLHKPPLPFEVTAPAAPSGRRSSRAPLRPLEWHKRLSMTDAQHAPSGSKRTYVPLTRSGQAMNVKTWFRDLFFGEYGWAPSKGHEERLTVEIEVILDSDDGTPTSLGPDTFELSHDPTRARNKDEAPTRLHWSARMLDFLTRNRAYVRGLIVLRRRADGGFELHLAKPEKDGPTNIGRPRGRASARGGLVRAG